MSPSIIRTAGPHDKARWLELWKGYLSFYKTPLDPSVTEATWSRIIDPISSVFTRLAIIDEHAVGFATCILHPRTWAIEPTCYLEDLFVDDAYRGQGLGKNLIDDLIAKGKKDGWTNLYWHTNSDNVTARKLYDRYSEADGYVRYRLPLTR